jgi:hypothetical protein
MSIDGGLRPLFRKKLTGFFWVPVETPMSGGGVPDHHWACDGIVGWNEYKKARGWRVKFRIEQPAWHEAYGRHGGRSFVIVRRTVPGADDLYVFRGRDAREIADNGLTDVVPLLLTRGGPARWDWERIAELLKRANF